MTMFILRLTLGPLALAAAVLGSACGRLGFESSGVDATTDGEIVDADVALVGWATLTGGAETTCGIRSERGYCWGDNSVGQLGVPGLGRIAVPIEVALPAGKVTHITQGWSHGCAVVEGDLYCWGMAALGDGVTGPSPVPVRATLVPSPVTAVSAGTDFTCAVSAGVVRCWGEDGNGALGNGAAGGSPLPAVVIDAPTTAVNVTAGADHACALIADGRVFCWGHDDGGALGTGTFIGESQTAVQVVGLVAAEVSIGGTHTCARDRDGAALCWGVNTAGELGVAPLTNRAAPATVLGGGVMAISVGGGYASEDATCAIVMDGKVMCWGHGDDGRLGTGTIAPEPLPVPIMGVDGMVFRSVTLGWTHTCAVRTDGEALCWGGGTSGQLGTGGLQNEPTPVGVTPP